MQHNDSTIKLAFQQSQRMDATDYIARSLIHDLKNHLGGISGAAELLKFDAGDNPSIEELCTLIMSATDNALETINGLSGYLHHPQVISDPFSIKEFFESQIPFYQACLGKQFSVNLDCETDKEIACDPIIFAHRCMNVVLNARESMIDRGSLNIKIANMDIAEGARPPYQQVKPGNYTDICIIDTGAGIPPDHLEEAINSNYSTKEHHAGMGLPLVNEFMRQHAGYLCLESTQDVGTKAHLLFPNS